jgi:hypothetical protein
VRFSTVARAIRNWNWENDKSILTAYVVGNESPSELLVSEAVSNE